MNQTAHTGGHVKIDMSSKEMVENVSVPIDRVDSVGRAGSNHTRISPKEVTAEQPVEMIDPAWVIWSGVLRSNVEVATDDDGG